MMPLVADLYERNEYGEFDDSSMLLEGSELRGYEAQITAALVKNRMPEETERGIMHPSRPTVCCTVRTISPC